MSNFIEISALTWRNNLCDVSVKVVRSGVFYCGCGIVDQIYSFIVKIHGSVLLLKRCAI